MIVVETIAELRRERSRFNGLLGLVPTMGFLHEGHLSLARTACKECEHVAATIFVNPTQFGPREDLEAYPRDLPRDLALLEQTGVDLVWTPSREVMYPPGFQTWVTVEEAARPLEGSMRPGHFRGVATVVAKLLNAVQPGRAYFGQKDAQQVAVIRQMVRDLNFPVEVVVSPTVREPDGLALSSRNIYLSPPERRAAAVLFRALGAAREAFENGEHRGEALRLAMKAVLEGEPLAQTQYVSCAHPDTLVELEQVGDEGALLSMAVFIGRTRLIDNIVLEGTRKGS